MVSIELLNKNSESEWDDFIDRHVMEEYGFSLKWRDMLREVFGYDSFYYLIRNDPEIIGVLPFFLVRSRIFGNRLISIPFTDMGGFYFRKEIQDDLKLTAFKIISKRLSSDLGLYSDKKTPIEIRNPDSASNLFLIKHCTFIKIKPYVTFKIRLDTSWHNIEGAFSRNIKRCLKKSQGQLKIGICSDKNQLADIYGIYLNDIKRFGSPPLPFVFFEGLWDKFYPEGNFIIFTASYCNKIIAAITLISFKNTIYADLIMSSFRHNHLFPKVQLYFASLNYAHNSRKYTYYNFNRSRRLSGVFEHKRKWGGRVEEIEYFYQNNGYSKDCFLDSSQHKFSVISRMLKYAPSKILRIAGKSMRKQLGK